MASKFVNDVHCVGLVIRVPPGIHVPLHAIPPVMLPTPIPASAFAAARPLGGSLTKMQAWDARMAEIDARRDALEKQYGRLSELFRLENTGPDENTYLDEWKNAYLDDETPHEGGLGSEKTKQRSRRKPPPDEMIPFFSRLPIGAGLSQSPRSAFAIAHTRLAKGALRPEGRIPSDCYHDCLRNTNPGYTHYD
jgi:hypothetical protein